MSDPNGIEPAPGPLRAGSAPDAELEQLLEHYKRTQAANPAGAVVPPPTFLVPPPVTSEPFVAPPVPAATAAHLDEQPLGFELPGAYTNAAAAPDPMPAVEPAPFFAVPEPVADVAPVDVAAPLPVTDFEDAVFDAPVSTRYIPEEFEEQLPEWNGPEVVAPADPVAVYAMGEGPSPWAAYEDVETHSDVEPELLPERLPVPPMPLDQLPPSFAALISGEAQTETDQPTAFITPVAPEPAAPVAPPVTVAEVPVIAPVAQVPAEQIPAAQVADAPVAMIDPFAGYQEEPSPAPHAQPAPDFAAAPAPQVAAPYGFPPEVPVSSVPVMPVVDASPAAAATPVEHPSVVAEVAPQPSPFDQPAFQKIDVPAPAAAPTPVAVPERTSFDAASFFDPNGAAQELHPVPEYTIPGPVTDEPAYVPPAATQPQVAAPVVPQQGYNPATAIPQPQQPTHAAPAVVPAAGGRAPLTVAGGSADPLHWLDAALRDLTAHGASDVHLAKSGATGNLIVRGRRDGALEFVHQFSDRDAEVILNLLKTTAKISTGSNRVPADGRYELPIDGYPYRIRAVSLPLFDGGEQLVLRLPQTGELKQLEGLGFWDPNLVATKSLARQPGGMTLIAGPMGEGKTTTAHAFLAEVGRGNTAITTVEDPVERVLPGVNQIEVNEDIGAGFGDIMKYLVRADFDTLFIGEIRDQATAVAAVRMAKAGRRVVATIHATDNVTALLRLIELSSDSPLSVLDAVRGVISQRLVRRLGDGPDGYLGRAPIHEVLTVNERLVEEMISGQSIGAIRAAAAETSTTFKQNITHLLDTGVTDKREAERVIGDV